MWLIILIVDNLVLLALFLWYRRQYRRKLEEVRNLITRDPLTKLYNRRGFEDMLMQIRRMSSHREPFAVLMIDVDHFKSINDTYGHCFGDAVLRVIGMLIEDECKGNGIVARFGGEEFVVILPQVTREQAVLVAEHIRNRVRTHVFDSHPELRITVSIGIGLSQESGAIVDSADKKLYLAKNAGRNKIIV